MKKNIKILSIIGLVLVIIAMSNSYRPGQYILETIGMIVLGAYGWNYFKDRTALLWISGLLALNYITWNYAFADLLFWILAFVFVYTDKND